MTIIEITADTAPAYKHFKWIIQHKDIIGGNLAIRGTRLSVSQILECLAAGMDVDDIIESYPVFPPESLPEVLTVAAQLADEARMKVVA